MSDNDFEAFQKNNKDKIQLIGLNISPYDPLDKSETNEDYDLDLKNQIDNVSNNKDKLDNNVKFKFCTFTRSFAILNITGNIKYK